MTNLAIKGHPTRGKEIIEILEMLGGINKYNLRGDTDEWFILNGTQIQRSGMLFDGISFTLEEFLEKYPYKVGDKVELNGIGVEITGMNWLDKTINYEGKSIKLGSEYDCLSVQDLKPYKEETMERGEDNWAKWDLPDGYEFQDEEGNVIKTSVIKLVKKQPQYPKTYEECCNILGIEDRENGYCGYNYELFGEFQKLYICRDAYWKIAGEQMGLDKPWEPDWCSVKQCKFGIYTSENQIKYITLYVLNNLILVFPTEEMRDAFYKNFKELIEFCKELL